MFNTLSGFFNRNAALHSIPPCVHFSLLQRSNGRLVPASEPYDRMLCSRAFEKLLCPLHAAELQANLLYQRTCPRTVQTERFRLEVTLCPRLKFLLPEIRLKGNYESKLV